MSESTPYPVEDRSLFFAPTTLRNCVVSWLVPGLGYFLLGRKKHGIIVATALIGAVVMGLIQGGDLYPLFSNSEGWIRGIGSFCQLGAGVPYALAKIIEVERSSPLSLTYDYGTNYFLIAGMINWLAVFDIFDISVKRK